MPLFIVKTLSNFTLLFYVFYTKATCTYTYNKVITERLKQGAIALATDKPGIYFCTG
jgi:hypothetical protein